MTLYNKVKYLKKINKKYSKRNRGKPKEPEYKTIKFEKTGVDFMARKPEKIYHNLETRRTGAEQLGILKMDMLMARILFM